MNISPEKIYQQSLKVLDDLFGKDTQFALATAQDNKPFVRFVDVYYFDGSFYLITYATSKKVVDIMANPHVALVSHRLHRFMGEATNIGHPLKPENALIREKLVQAFEKWYFLANNEKDPHTCLIQIKLHEGFFYKDEVGYKVDFINKTATSFPFHFGITILD